VRPKDKESKLPTALAGSDLTTTSFTELGLPHTLVDVLRQRGITTPLPIQAAAIADVLAGRDVSGKAPTGSGKTLAFALPIATNLNRSVPRHPRGLVLAPTRELANQIASEMGPLLKAHGLKAHPFYGGVGFSGQRHALRRGVDVAVACPGRLEDLMGSGDIDLSHVDVVVVDEADRMADMGFLPAVSRILDATPSSRQTLLFSATLDGDVDVLVRRYQRNPVRCEVDAREEVNRATHEFRAVASADRTALCAELVLAPGSSVVFVRTKQGADRVARRLKDAGAAAAAIHGDRSQAQRERTLADFRAGKVRTLVATDVAARGIHVDDVARVIHFDLPADVKDYVHRSGRTARAGAGGTVVAFVTPEKRALAASLKTGIRLAYEGSGEISGTGGRPPATPQSGTKSLPTRGGRHRVHGPSGMRRAQPGKGATGHSARASAEERQGGGGASRPRKPRGSKQRQQVPRSSRRNARVPTDT
jgi:superfamily II DNA/RNA helicase